MIVGFCGFAVVGSVFLFSAYMFGSWSDEFWPTSSVYWCLGLWHASELFGGSDPLNKGSRGYGA